MACFNKLHKETDETENDEATVESDIDTLINDVNNFFVFMELYISSGIIYNTSLLKNDTSTDIFLNYNESSFSYNPNTDPIDLTGVGEQQQQQQQQPQVETVTEDNKDSLVESDDEIESNSIKTDAENQPSTNSKYPDDIQIPDRFLGEPNDTPVKHMPETCQTQT